MNVSEDIKKYLPQYLSDGAKGALVRSLGEYPNNLNSIFMEDAYYNTHKDKILQADVFECKNIYENINAKIMVISNSCDNSEENQRFIPINISYIPLIDLGKLKEKLETDKFDKEKIDNFMNAVKKQQITSMFYIPAQNDSNSEMVALFDSPMSTGLKIFKSKIVKKIYSLSNYGFYIFLFKLSYHFTRIKEGTQRG
ncbi:hypothetical protein ACHJH3_08630 [Campylobacter sp. MOP7]|uniref:hypothetical protein n=1 Tax=Campylobacter canis TaxID=3378588 RepID=UPI00387E3AE3